MNSDSRIGKVLTRVGMGENVLAQATIRALGFRLTGAALAFGLQILLARLLGATKYGDYIYAFTVMLMAAALLKLGLDMITVRYVPLYRGQEKWHLLRGLLRRTLQVQIGSSTLAAALLLSTLWLLRERLQIDLLLTLYTAAPLVIVLALQYLYEARVRALGHMTLARLPEEVFQPLFLAAFVGVVFLARRGEIQASWAMACTLAAAAAALAITAGFFRSKKPVEISTAAAVFQTRSWLVTAIQIATVGTVMLVMRQIDTLLVGYFLGTTPAGLYATASRISKFIPLGLTAINLSLGPMISSFQAPERRGELQKTVRLAAGGIVLIATPIALGVIVFSDKVLGLFGTEFTQARSALIVLVLGHLIGAASGSTSLLLTMTGHQGKVAIVTGVSAIVDVLLHVVLIPRFGIVGAATATAATIALWNLVLIFLVKRELGIDCTVFSLITRRSPGE